MGKSYFITVRDPQVALAIDPLAELVRTLPATKHYKTFCCAAPIATPIPPAYIYYVEVDRRKDAEKAPGVIRCRAKEPEKYRTVLVTEMC